MGDWCTYGVFWGVVVGLGGGSWEGMVEEDGAKAGDACFSRLCFGLARSPCGIWSLGWDSLDSS